MLGYNFLKFFHVLGSILMGAGLVGVWIADLRSRQIRELPKFAEYVRAIAVFYDGLVVPGALFLLISGAWLTVQYYDGWAFLQQPWLAAMIALFLAEFIEGNTITRLYFMRLRRMTQHALSTGAFTPELNSERGKLVPSFTHFLDLPILVLLVALGVFKPNTWALFFIGSCVALVVASLLTWWILHLYPWQEDG